MVQKCFIPKVDILSFPWQLQPVKVWRTSLHYERNRRNSSRVTDVTEGGSGGQHPLCRRILNASKLDINDLETCEIFQKPSWNCSSVNTVVTKQIDSYSRHVLWSPATTVKSTISWSVRFHGAHKSLALPGRKQDWKHVRDARDFNKFETRPKIYFFLQGKAPKKIDAILTKTLGCFHPGRAKDLSASLYCLHYKWLNHLS